MAFKTNFPRKTALELALRTGESVSFCEKCLIGQRQPGAAMLSALLRSDIGRTVLTALMAGSDAAWWREFSRQLELAALARQQAELQRTAEANRERLMRALAGEGAAS
ncbi:MAG: hypothetical protein EPO23_03405 [Xanthobacteraceae bacterium]|nr:MAG: hypothetical protein EPO23_03405 [Xanthobacteraceae bacterium]